MSLSGCVGVTVLYLINLPCSAMLSSTPHGGEASSELSETRLYSSKNFGSSTKPHHRPFFLFRPFQEFFIMLRTGLFGPPSPARRASSAFWTEAMSKYVRIPQSPLRLSS
ncbi:uncharacterized protein F5147DRAFT_697424, partial [Suillus discolor]